MKIPKISIGINKQLDKEAISDFFGENDPLILNSFPEIVDLSDVDEVVNREYREELESIKVVVKKLKQKTYILEDFCDSLSVIMEETWDGVDSLNVFIGICPIAPRYLIDCTCLLPHYQETDILINWAAHEFTHFLYFKKYQKIYPEVKVSEYEFPNEDWALSEILAPVICEQQTLKRILGTKSELYPQWKNLNFGGDDLIDIFSDIYNKSENFTDFIISSKEKYKDLNKKYRLHEVLIQALN